MFNFKCASRWEERIAYVHTTSVREQGVLDVCALWQEEQSENQAWIRFSDPVSQ